MDTAQLISDAKARFSHNAAKVQLKDKYSSKLIVAEQGGLWTAKPELLTFLSGTLSTTLVVIDNFDNPVKVNRVELLTKLTDTYNTVMNEWYLEWSELEKKR
jgi:hypothetical protein